MNDGNQDLQIHARHLSKEAQPFWKVSGGEALTGVMNDAVYKRLWLQAYQGQELTLMTYLTPYCKIEYNGCSDAHSLSESELVDLLTRVTEVLRCKFPNSCGSPSKGSFLSFSPATVSDTFCPLPPSAATSFSFQTITSGDPNDKSGPPGAGAARWVPANQPLNYQIFFSNEPNASAAAQTVTITDQLDPTKVDFITLALGPIYFGVHTLTPPPGVTSYSTVVDLRPAQTLAVNINASFDPSNGVLTWSYTSIDPTTGNPPADSTVGFLPPDNDPPNGEGNVLFSVMPIGNLATGTQIANQAAVVFDVNPAINTAVWTNTIAQTSDSRLKASPRHLHFSNQKIGTTSAVQVVKIFNAGNGGGYGQGLTIEGFTATGDFVTGKSDCPQPPKTLTAGDSCSVQVAFAPGSPGRRQGSLFAFSNAINGPRTVALAGVNKQARLKIEPAELDFGAVAVGRSSNPLPVMLTDAGSEPLNLTDIAAVGDFTQTNDCASSLAPGKSCTASVIFSPTEEGRRHGFMMISDDAFNSPQRLKLVGNGR